MENLDRYVGHIVRLERSAYQRLVVRESRTGALPDNRFIVASASHRLRKLVCYNANLRLTVSASDVALI